MDRGCFGLANPYNFELHGGSGQWPVVSGRWSVASDQLLTINAFAHSYGYNLTPEASTTTAPNFTLPASAYRLSAACTLRFTVSHSSGGIRSSSGRKGTAIDFWYSQTSSSLPGQIQGSVSVFSSMCAYPARRSTSDKLPGCANLNGSRSPGGIAGAPTCFRTIPIVFDQYGWSNGPHATEHARPPDRSTR